MSKRSIVLRPADQPGGVAEALLARFSAIREQLKVRTEFPPEVLAEASTAASRAKLPERDETALPFVTIDPPGSMDLDQAVHIERDGDGYRVRYAIADVSAFVTPGGAIDTEARARVQTIYCPDRRVQLHPAELSEGAASLLPDQVRPAFVWDIRCAADGEGTSVEVARAMVKSVRRYTYAEVQDLVDAGQAEPTLVLLKELGEKRIALEAKRGGASLPMPEQEVEENPDGTFTVTFRPLLPSEDWNAQISLLTGMGAADLMLRHKVGILRTMPDPDPRDLKRFRREAQGLGITWPEGMTYGQFLRTLDRDDPRHLALIHSATSLFRGAAYTAFDGEVPDQPKHSAVANPYAHTTAPLRRLVDRFVLALCEALCAGSEVPAWVREAMPTIPEIMAEGDRRARSVERACTDAVEAAELVAFVGQQIDGVVVEADDRGTVVQLRHPAVVQRATGSAKAGDAVTVTVVAADVPTGTVQLAIS